MKGDLPRESGTEKIHRIQSFFMNLERPILNHIVITSSITALRVIIPREERGIEESNGKEFLARKSGEENEELTGLNKDLFRGKTRKLRKKVEEKFNLKNFNA